LAQIYKPDLFFDKQPDPVQAINPEIIQAKPGKDSKPEWLFDVPIQREHRPIGRRTQLLQAEALEDHKKKVEDGFKAREREIQLKDAAFNLLEIICPSMQIGQQYIHATIVDSYLFHSQLLYPKPSISKTLQDLEVSSGSLFRLEDR
jgi:hypothetical protein